MLSEPGLLKSAGFLFRMHTSSIGISGRPICGASIFNIFPTRGFAPVPDFFTGPLCSSSRGRDDSPVAFAYFLGVGPAFALPNYLTGVYISYIS